MKNTHKIVRNTINGKFLKINKLKSEYGQKVFVRTIPNQTLWKASQIQSLSNSSHLFCEYKLILISTSSIKVFHRQKHCIHSAYIFI